jgi:hypothetical protein
VTKEFVVDASIGIAWVHPAQATTQSQALLELVAGAAVVRAPALWGLLSRSSSAGSRSQAARPQSTPSVGAVLRATPAPLDRVAGLPPPGANVSPRVTRALSAP